MFFEFLRQLFSRLLTYFFSYISWQTYFVYLVYAFTFLFSASILNIVFLFFL